jgi:hypothetical protein
MEVRGFFVLVLPIFYFLEHVLEPPGAVARGTR